MSNLYNLANGMNPMAAHVLTALGLEANKLPRFRDAAYVADAPQPVLQLLCRIGGGSMPFYETAVTELRAHANYESDEDWYRDSTYRVFVFRIPEDLRSTLRDQYAAVQTERAAPGDIPR